MWRRSRPKISRRVAPLREIRFRARSVSPSRAGNLRGDDELRAGAQQLEARLITDLHAAAGQQRNPSVQVGQLGPFGEVERCARRAELIVK